MALIVIINAYDFNEDKNDDFIFEMEWMSFKRYKGKTSV